MEAPVRERALGNESVPPPTLSPAVPPYVRLGLTVVYTIFYSLLFVFVYAQLWMVLRYRHKRLSYQTVFLFLCLLWAALRAVLFSFYFRNFVAANTLGPFPFWLLYCFPVCLQFFTLSLMNLYFAQVVFKAKSKYAPELHKFRFPLYVLFLSLSVVFLVVNLTCALLVRTASADAQTIVLVRVAINDTLFVLCAVSLSLCLYKIAKMSLANIYLESKVREPVLMGTSVCQVTVIGAMVILLYISRACYNLVVLALPSIKRINSFDYDWYNVSDQADLQSTLGEAGYVVFGVILFVWELLPTSLVVFFFRVRRPPRDRSCSGIPGHIFSSRGYFFDNPRRYDSDDDLAWSIIPHNSQASFTADSYDWGSRNSSLTPYTGGQDPSPPPEELNPY
ncbi:G protein-coupled receptor 137Ba isoform X1 [Hypomesus transpacificus]|uniref:G protein-coupled receptor 137Ba isoform X1 n=1 Tax=Hypomesus transpacificus TaxID=137520 RepID=UPI001F07A16F|nr:G protein-coupled receptor 137Ba isoform X1 [Hypomesus transpacificus]XP_046885999.1 G protein-coupled receptor 137Ba isoform X1 [Hypomesus transpacificus]